MQFTSWHMVLFSLVSLIASLVLEKSPGWSQTATDNVELLDVIEVPGTAVVRKPQNLTFPRPEIINHRPLPTEDLVPLPYDFKSRDVASQSVILLDTKGKTHGVRTSPKPLKAERPSYPRFAREQAWDGITILRITIDTDGRVTSATTRKSSGHSILDESALQSVKRWIFAPAKNGEFVIASTVDLPIRFDLDQPN